MKLFKDAYIYDGTGADAFNGDVLVENDKIVKVDKCIEPEDGWEVIDLKGLSIAPGFIDTDMTMALPETTREEIIKNIPMRRCGKTNEVAQVALFLASDMASYVNGEVIKVDGGM